MSTSATMATDQIKARLAATNQIFNDEVFANRNFDALDKIYTESARILPPGAPMISGRQAIKEFWSRLILSVNATRAVLTSIEVTAAGDGIVEIGKATLTVQPEGQGKSEMEVKYVVFWRQEESTWKWHIDIWKHKQLAIRIN